MMMDTSSVPRTYRAEPLRRFTCSASMSSILHFVWSVQWKMKSILLLLFGFLLISVEQSHAWKMRAKVHRSHHWLAGPWSPCAAENGCGDGWRLRPVSCVNGDEVPASHRRCHRHLRPRSMERCYAACSHQQHFVRWQAGEWIPCERVGAQPHLRNECRPGEVQIGVSRRNITCVFQPQPGTSSRVVDSAACDHQVQPVGELSCTIPCPQDCVVTPYEDWPKCSNTCVTHTVTRRRTVVVGPENGGEPCPPLSETKLCLPHRDCVSWRKKKSRRKAPHEMEFLLKVGPWSECRTEHVKRSTSSAADTTELMPQVGIKKRNISCIDQDGVAVDIRKCRPSATQQMSPLPSEVESCVIKVDCEVSSWSDWQLDRESCLLDNGDLAPMGPRQSRRWRSILQLPFGGGWPCPPLQEVVEQTQHLPLCSSFEWITSEWTACVPHDGKLCNGGVRHRNATCVRTKDEVPFPSHLCVLEHRPPVQEECIMPCPVDCQVTHWAPWGQCLPLIRGGPFPAPEEGYRVRVRYVETHLRFGGKDCPHLKEVESCDRAVLSHWEPEPWTRCKPLEGNECGAGVESRNARCAFFDGTMVDDVHCIIYESPLERERECSMPCPEDCVLSEWSAWSPCTSLCAEKMSYGIQSRNRSILAYPSKGGASCPPKSELKEIDDCNMVSCYGFRWKVENWGQCIATGKNATCGTGKRTREVRCFYKGPVSDKKCVPLKKPESSQACTVPCPEDCKMTKFSEWRRCSDCAGGGNIMVRERFVIRNASHGGRSCPWRRLREERPCNSAKEPWCRTEHPSSSVRYRWNTSDWSSCVLPHHLLCGTGHQVRNLTCVDSNLFSVDYWHCINASISSAEGQVFSIPTLHRKCHISCEDACTLTEWTEWSSCRDNCENRISYRNREVVGISSIRCGAELLEKRPCPETPVLSRGDSEWSECILHNDEASDGLCGGGNKYRRARKRTLQACKETALQKESCRVPCPRDCIMNDWTEWTPCTAVCGTGTRTRSRTVSQHSNFGGRPCPVPVPQQVQTETDVCIVHCGRNIWLPGGWTRCRQQSSSKKLHCGMPGVRSRNVLCMSLLNGQPHEELDPSNCDPLGKPPEVEECMIGCPGECVVSEWSDWTSCSGKNATVRNRTRHVLRLPSSEHSCPYLWESDACVEHHWETDSYGSCILDKHTSCGKGLARMFIYCVRKPDGLRVDFRYCNEEEKPPKDVLLKECTVPCPIDCEMSEWSAWDSSACEVCETFGNQVRRREILQNASESGRPCPDGLSQEIPCPYMPCYKWILSSWSACDLDGADCGFGQRKRAVKCQRSDGVFVDKSWCHLGNFTNALSHLPGYDWLVLGQGVETEQECYVTCPNSCSLFSWSEWSPCNRNCDTGEIIGQKTRSRAVVGHLRENSTDCPIDMMETRPCWDGVCLTFSWRVHEGTLKCLRSDGLVVEGGCRGRPRPCVPACPMKARCEPDSGQCACLSGTVPVFEAGSTTDALSRLARCEPIRSAMDAPHADNHTAVGAGDIILKYYPDDNEASFWMYAMISVGSAFIIFVAVTVYLMCNPSFRQKLKSPYLFKSRRRQRPAATVVGTDICCSYEPAPTSSSTAASALQLY
ncbi:thrombospondin type-1 domain-containing protein 7B-like isoform X2 [Ornithodoros turicata]|uniref:thrombospondin type-1 domain-containing protein 7B-like isoform X2 n=1 Tax=Ornithodoros turicata TaxID=34597 RepID=UPI003138E5D5